MRFAGTALNDYMSTPNFTGLGKNMIAGQSLGRRTVNQAEGDVALAGISATAKVKASEYEADAIRAGGQARGQSAMFSGIGNMISGIAGGFGSMGGNTYGFGSASNGQYQVPFGFNGGSYAGRGTLGPNWGIPQ